ncbi:DUF6503 family protein [Pontimicrobium aquaticum]|uniref:Deoxyribose-phosphate aldolase n=1 Tax=Pontimicrobium aquaticum TaxID=2565367 RepID=A0A4U0EVT0_9FLAO|nr:DUF6503 family protein [Pontimicrobium aquaticum]TJY36057.1 deoxyribose-phosphate aldolase [Pontimicrobium aquaticum]
MKHILYSLILMVVVTSCKQEKALTAQEIVDKAIEVSGGEKYKASTISFDFRDIHYKAIRNNGMYQYERVFNDSLGKINDVLSNDGFKRFINEKQVKVVDSMAAKYTRSVNSVHYFVVLPFGLNDAAVNKEYIGDATIKNKGYYKIKVHFNQEGGGDDFEDVFMYWINKEDFKIDYLAYSYMDSPTELGLRFREAYNERYVNGLRFVDYKNYKPEDGILDLIALDSLFESGKLKLLSKIENVNIEVE